MLGWSGQRTGENDLRNSYVMFSVGTATIDHNQVYESALGASEYNYVALLPPVWMTIPVWSIAQTKARSAPNGHLFG